MFTSMFIRRSAATSHKQVVFYIKKGLLPKSIITPENTIDLSLEDLDKLFKIKVLQKMGFSLENIKIFLDNLKNDKELFKMFYEFIESEKNGLETLLDSLADIEADRNNLQKKDAFYFSNKIILAPYIAKSVFEIKKKWFEDEDKKDFLRKWRKNFYLLFKCYECTNPDEQNPKIFKELNGLSNFFQENYNFKSMMSFFVFINWLTVEPRYIKEMKRISKYNYANEIMNLTIYWFCEKY